jgi:hypothetical protein
MECLVLELGSADGTFISGAKTHKPPTKLTIHGPKHWREVNRHGVDLKVDLIIEVTAHA